MEKLFDYIASRYDSSIIKKIYGVSLRKYLDCGIDYRYIDDIHILKMFHEIYLDVKDKYDEYYLKDIKMVSDKYLFLVNRMKEYKESGDYNKNNFEVSHEPFIDNECIDYVRKNSSMFSLNDYLKISNSKYSIGGVCLISKVQTVCMYNDDSFGYIGSGYHNDSFHKILKAIYNEKFTDGAGLKFNDIGQDIKISFSSETYDSLQVIRIFVDIPVPINSSQLESLKIFNGEIKKYNGDNIAIEVSASIVNYYDEDFLLEFDDCDNLDDALKWVIISDTYKPSFEDKNIVGFRNGENHFNDGDIKIGKQK